MPALPDELDPYRCDTPYDVLGVPPDASAKEIKNKYTKVSRDLQASALSTSEHGKRKKILDTAYDQLRSAGKRVRIDFSLLDHKLGIKQCEAIAKTLEKPNTDAGNLIKPRKIRVTHEALLGKLETFVSEPERVVGLNPKPIELSESADLPELLAVQFDC